MSACRQEMNLSQNWISSHLRDRTESGCQENQWVAIMLRRSTALNGDFEIGSCEMDVPGKNSPGTSIYDCCHEDMIQGDGMKRLPADASPVPA